MLLTAGERISMALLAMAIKNLGHSAQSFTGSQAGVITDSVHNKARIIDVTPGRIRTALDEGNIAIVAGFQGVSQDKKDITTLGRGGSDRHGRRARRGARRRGLRDLHRRGRRVHRRPAGGEEGEEDRLDLLRGHAGARRLRLQGAAPPLCGVRPPLQHPDPRALVLQRAAGHLGQQRTDQARGPEGGAGHHFGVAHDTSEAKVTVVGVPDKPGEAASIFRAIADAEINIDMVVQNVSAASTGLTEGISFTLPKTEGRKAIDALEKAKNVIGFDSLRYDDQIGKISLVGAGMKRTRVSRPASSRRCPTRG